MQPKGDKSKFFALLMLGRWRSSNRDRDDTAKPLPKS
jgi:hypothetical protein